MQTVSQRLRTAYLKLCYAGLQQDMAQRIMFSTLPFLANPAQVALTEGVVDTHALKAAVEGRKNIIKYGVLAVLGELENYNDHHEDMSKEHKGKGSIPYRKCARAIQDKKFGRAMEIAIEAFREPEPWYTNYGGRPWEMIARAIRQIARLDHQLDIVRGKPRSVEGDKQELQLMRDLVVEMNVFDGLAHNSDSILNNLTELEANDVVPASNPNERKKRHKENYVQLKRLMDAKELDSPVEVYKLLQDTLVGSGDIHKFKDWVTKMRNQKEYHQTDPKLTDKLLRIYLRKAVMPARAELNTARDSMNKEYKVLERSWDVLFLKHFVSMLNQHANYALIIAHEFDEHKDAFIEQYPDLSPKTVTSLMDRLSAHAIGIANDIVAVWRNVESMYERMDGWSRLGTVSPEDIADLKDHILQSSKAGLSYFNQFSYFLDRI